MIQKKKVSLPKINGIMAVKFTHNIILSIIIPVYNVEKYIRTCLESVYKQGINDEYFEVIIINDGTKDRSIDLIQDIISLHKNIIVYTQDNKGISTTRNKGIEIANGRYIFMLDSDDLLIDNSLSLLLGKALSDEYDLIVADYTEMTDDSIAKNKINYNYTINFEEKTGEQLLLEDLNPRKCYLWRILYRKDFLIKEKISFIPGIIFEDIPFVHMCFLKARKCLRTNLLVYIYRRGVQTSETSIFTKKKAIDLSIVISELWKMTKIKGLSDSIYNKLQNDTFVTFSILMYAIVYNIDNSKDRLFIINNLKQHIPDLQFRNGVKQKMNNFMYHKMGHTYINLRVAHKKFIKPIIKQVSSFFQQKK